MVKLFPFQGVPSLAPFGPLWSPFPAIPSLVPTPPLGVPAFLQTIFT